MEERHIASVIVKDDSYLKHDPSHMASLFVKPGETSTDPAPAMPVDQRYVASVFVGEQTQGYEHVSNTPVEHQYAQIGDNERDNTPPKETSKPIKDKSNEVKEKTSMKHKILRVRTLVISIIIALIIGVLIGVFAFLAVQHLNGNKNVVDAQSTPGPQEPTTQSQKQRTTVLLNTGSTTTGSSRTAAPSGSVTGNSQTAAPSGGVTGNSQTTATSGGVTGNSRTTATSSSMTGLQTTQ